MPRVAQVVAKGQLEGDQRSAASRASPYPGMENRIRDLVIDKLRFICDFGNNVDATQAVVTRNSDAAEFPCDSAANSPAIPPPGGPAKLRQLIDIHEINGVGRALFRGPKKFSPASSGIAGRGIAGRDRGVYFSRGVGSLMGKGER
jgi:hypothetical protein